MTRHETVGEKVHFSFGFEDAEDLNEDEESRKLMILIKQGRI